VTVFQRLNAGENRIDLWLCAFEGITDSDLLARYEAMLSPEELARRDRLYRPRDQRRFLVTRALVRTILSRYSDRPPESWVFAANAHGRPEIAGDDPAARGLVFNLSHTDGLIVMGVTGGQALGVDVERLARRVPLGVAGRFFAPEEVEALHALPIRQQRRRFLDYWTLKESYIKARGMGLAIPLRQFSFHFPSEGRVTLATQPELEDAAERWRLWQFLALNSHLIAVCAEGRSGSRPSVESWSIIPLMSEVPLGLELLRTSDP